MKNISKYFALAFTGLLMAACDGDYTDWADPQSYDQENAITIPGFTASGVAPVNLADVTDNVKLFTINETALPEGYVLENARIELTPSDIDGANPTTVHTTLDGIASVSDIQTLIENIYGKRPVSRVFDAHVYASAVKNGVAMLIDAGTVKVDVTPVAPFIDSAYYIVGDMNGWSAVSFSHSGKDVYDDPVFTITFETKVDNQYWKIIPQTNIDNNDIWAVGVTGVVGVVTDGDSSMSGSLTTQNPQAGKIDVAGWYKMTIDMMDYTYTIEKFDFPEYLYVAGSGNGWAHKDVVSSLKFDGNYTGFMYLGNEFKFSTQPDWNGTSYGENFSTDGGAGNMTLPAGYAEGYYMVKMSLADQTLNLTEITTIGIIGDAAPKGWDSSVPLTYNAAERCWEGDVTFTDGTFKFRANDAWDISWGGSFDDLTIDDGANMSVTKGTYHVALYPNCPGKAYCTLTAK